MIPLNEQIINPKEIILGEYKPEEEALEKMKVTIKQDGLFHPPIVREDKIIVAGRLRVSACVALGLSKIRCLTCASDLPRDEYIALSLNENLKRNNLQWYDIVISEKELHELRMRQAGEADQGVRGKKADWGLRETAAELDISLGRLSEDLQMANAIILDPSLRRVQDKITAKKVIFEAIRRTRQDYGASKPVGIDTNTIHLGHSDAVLKAFPDNIFDACITDPPWLEFKDSSLTRDEFTLPVFKEVYRVLKSNSFLYMFLSTQDYIYYMEELPKIGFNVQKFPLIWVKEGVLTYGRKTWEYQRDYEHILLAVKGAPALTSSMISAIMSCKIVPSAKLLHPNEKPVEVIKRIIDHCTFEGALILDPFAGSFVVPFTAKLMGRRYVAIEKNPSFYNRGEERLK